MSDTQLERRTYWIMCITTTHKELNHLSCLSPQHTPPRSANPAHKEGHYNLAWQGSPLTSNNSVELLLPWRPGNCTVLQWELTWNITVDKYSQVFPNQKPRMTSIVWMLLQACDSASPASTPGRSGSTYRSISSYRGCDPTSRDSDAALFFLQSMT